MTTLSINLQSRPNRWQRMEQQCAAAGLAGVERLAGIRPHRRAGWPTIGRRGCWLSHLAAARRAEELGSELTLILEDDVAFHPHFPELFPRLVQELQASPAWDICHLGAHGSRRPAGAMFATIANPVLQHARVVHRRALPRIIAALEQTPSRTAPPDAWHSDIWLGMKESLVQVCADPELAWQQAGRSDVEDSWTDRSRLELKD
ncbi:MAG TPA: hypothetical protein VF614_16705 [Chthoniobacteraceae bacterium]